MFRVVGGERNSTGYIMFTVEKAFNASRYIQANHVGPNQFFFMRKPVLVIPGVLYVCC